MQLHGLLLIYRSQRDGRLSWPGWLTHSGHFSHEVVTCQPQIRHRSGKVRQPNTDVLTNEPRRSKPKSILFTGSCNSTASRELHPVKVSSMRDMHLCRQISESSTRSDYSVDHPGKRIYFQKLLIWNLHTYSFICRFIFSLIPPAVIMHGRPV